MSHFNGRIRKAARLAWHEEYGANHPAAWRSGQELRAMQLTDCERLAVEQVVAWMVAQVKTKDRWW